MLRARSIYFKPFIYAAKKEKEIMLKDMVELFLSSGHNKSLLTIYFPGKKSIL